MTEASEDIPSRVWPAFKVAYSFDGGNVAELHIAACAQSRADEFLTALLDGGGEFLSACDVDAHPLQPSEVGRAFRQLCDDPVSFLAIVIRWNRRVYWLYWYHGQRTSHTADLEVLYRDEQPLISGDRTEEENFREFVAFLRLGVLLYEVCGADALAIHHEGIFVSRESAPQHPLDGIIVLPTPE